MPSLLQRLAASTARVCAALALVAAGCTAFVLAITTMPGSSPKGEMPPVSAEERVLAAELRQHVQTIASTPHNVQHLAQLEAAALYLEAELSSYGYQVRREEFQASGRTVRNLEVTIPSRSAPGRATVVVGAHYDAWGLAPGANDNGTGTAAVLALARRLRSIGETAAADLVLVLYTNEEPPYFRTQLMGSAVHAQALKARGANVVAMLSLETMGWFSDAPGSQKYPWPLDQFYPREGNFIAFVASTGEWRFVRRVTGLFRAQAAFPSEGIAAPRFIPGIDFSDHAAYLDAGYPALMVTDTAPYRYPHYHTREDTPDKVDYERLARVVGGLARVITELVHAP